MTLVHPVVDTVFESVAGSFEAGLCIEWGFGSFGLKEWRERIGRNPKNGEGVSVKARRVLFFETGKVLREWVSQRLSRR